MRYVNINKTALPKDEHEAADWITRNLSGLVSLSAEFRHCAELYMHFSSKKVDENTESVFLRQRAAFIRIAGRVGALNAYGMSKLIQEIGSSTAPEIWNKADTECWKEVEKVFFEEFPYIREIRNSASHPMEFSRNPQETKRHLLKEAVKTEATWISENSGLMIEASVHVFDDHMTFKSTVQGKMASYELSYRKAGILDQVVDLCYKTFYPLESSLDAQMRRITP